MVWILCSLACAVGFGSCIAYCDAIGLQSLGGGACFSAALIMAGMTVYSMFWYLPPGISSGNSTGWYARHQALKIVDEVFEAAKFPDHALYGRCWEGTHRHLRDRIQKEC